LSKIIRDESDCVISPFEFSQATEDILSGVSRFVVPAASALVDSGQSSRVSEAAFEEARAAARREGFEEGLQTSRREAESAASAQRDARLDELQTTVRQLVAYRSEIRIEVEHEIVDLAFAVARRVLRREVTLDPTAAAGIVRSCMDERSASEVTRILVHPHDVEQVQRSVGPEVSVEASTDVEPGGALLETTRGTLDARIDSQIDELQSGLAGA
jgi:flagellar assembly protein FliH